MRRNLHLVVLGLILVVAAAVRLYHLSSVPTELIVDELDLYNSAQSIATTGHDLDGGLRPFLYSAVTRNPPIYAIAGYTSSLVLGKTPFGLRFPAVIFGLLSIIFLYGITRELTRRRDVALIAALIMATQPLFIQFSRVAWEPASELPFLLGGLYVVLRTLRRTEDGGDPRAFGLGGLAIGGLLSGLTSYTYMAGWFYAFILGGGLLLLFGLSHRLSSKLRLVGTFAFSVLVAVPALWMWFFDPHTMQRTHRISTFASGITLGALQAFASNYLAHFRWSYLVVNGDPINGVTWRYLNGFGAFAWWVIPLGILGLVALARYVRPIWCSAWVWLWLVAYPLGGALTNEGAPNAPRTLAGAPVFCILAAIGLVLLIDMARTLRPSAYARVAVLAVRGLFAVALAVPLASFCTFYFTRYVHINPNAWDSGTAKLFDELHSIAPGHVRICFAVRQAWYGTSTYALYYLADTPIAIIQDTHERRCLLPGTILAVDPDHIPKQPARKISTIYDVDGAVFAFVYLVTTSRT